MLENMDLRELARDRVYEFLYVNLTNASGARRVPRCGRWRSADRLAYSAESKAVQFTTTLMGS